MSLYTLRPISDRTQFTGRHRTSPFGATWTATRALLARELRQLKAQHTVLEIDVSEVDVRLDGELRASARPTTPAVRLAFDSKHGPLQYATDAFWSWQDNVRAIALGLEALRRVDRYGITKRGEQYAGWKALPSGSGADASHMTREQASAVIAEHSGDAAGDADMATLIRRAKASAHPDRNAGDRTLWDQVEQAIRVLEDRP